MYIIKYTSAFKKGYKRMMKRGVDMSLLDNVIEDLHQGRPLEDKYKDHMLKGEYHGYHECHIQPDWLLIYLVEEDIVTLTLTATGTHSDLFDL